MENYKTLDECIPDNQYFQDWVYKTHLRIHPKIIEYNMFGRLITLLKNNEDWSFKTFIEALNEYNMELNLFIPINMLAKLCELYCSDIRIINYRNKNVVVVGDYHIIGVVYYCKTEKIVKILDYDEYDEEEIEEILNKEE